MGLLQLPGELLDDIIDQTLPHGLESFVLCCRAVYGRARNQILRHNRLKRISRYARRPSNDRGKALLLLYEISRDPLLAQYIDVLNLRDPARGFATHEAETPPLVDLDEFRMETGAMDEVRELVERSDWIQEAGVDVEDWWDMMMNEDIGAEDQPEGQEELPCTIVALLSQLPNLVSLQLPDSWRRFSPFEDASVERKLLVYALDSLVTYARDNVDSATPLQRLETIFPFMPTGYDSRAGLQCVEPFLCAPGLRELFGVSLIAVEDNYTGIPFQWRSQVDSPLRRLELAHCCIDADGIGSLLAHTPLLQVFRYSHETKWHGCQHDWNAGSFVDTISRHCGSTITDLSLTVDYLTGDIVNGASTFLGFPNLANLEVDVLVFCGPPIESGQRRGLSAVVPPGEIPWVENDIPCIGSMAPGSIVSLTINMDFPHRDAQALHALLKNIKQQKSERLPQLQPVVLRQHNGDSAKLVFGIEGVMEVVNGDENEALPRYMMPVWKREFAKRVGGIATSR
jgi:hypothetical protein